MPRPYGALLAAALCLASSDAFAGVRAPAPRRSRLFMGWGPDPIWSPVEVASVADACESKSSVTIQVAVSDEAKEAYQVPGQYVQVRLDEGTESPLFLAIASPPRDENVFEFLIKKTDNNVWLTDEVKAGSKVEMSQVLGNGFPVEEQLNSLKYDFPTQNVLLIGTGSGIAPLKAALESDDLKIGESAGRTARLYYGVRTPEDMCFVDKFPEWESRGVQVVPVVSQPPEEWNGRTGYVQTALAEDGVPIPRNSGALLCGQKGMAEAVTNVLNTAGVLEGRVLTNF